MYFDGASRSPDGKKEDDPKKNRVGIVFVTPDKGLIPYAFCLTEGCSNNEAEYEAVIAGLELALKIPIDDLTIYGDSELIVKQLRGDYKIKGLTSSLIMKRSIISYQKSQGFKSAMYDEELMHKQTLLLAWPLL